MSGRIVTVIKQPAEELRQRVHFVGLVAVASVVSVDVVSRGTVSGDLLEADAELAAGLVDVVLSGGADGDHYLVTVRAEGGGGQIVEAELEVVILDASWVMPDGGAAYLTIGEFVARFGLGETVRMTDGVGDGRIDRDYLVSALVDAQAIVEAHIADRYALPLSTVPQLVKTWIGDIARARLYPGGAPEGVEKAGAQSLRMLEHIRDGKMTLPGGSSLEAAPSSDNPILHFSGGRTYPDNLRRFR